MCLSELGTAVYPYLYRDCEIALKYSDIAGGAYGVEKLYVRVIRDVAKLNVQYPEATPRCDHARHAYYFAPLRLCQQRTVCLRASLNHRSF